MLKNIFICGYTASCKSSIIKGVTERMDCSNVDIYDISSSIYAKFRKVIKKEHKGIANSLVPVYRWCSMLMIDPCPEGRFNLHSRSVLDAIAIAHRYAVINNAVLEGVDYSPVIKCFCDAYRDNSLHLILINDRTDLIDMEDKSNKYRKFDDYEFHRDEFVKELVALCEDNGMEYQVIRLSDLGNNLDDIVSTASGYVKHLIELATK